MPIDYGARPPYRGEAGVQADERRCLGPPSERLPKSLTASRVSPNSPLTVDHNVANVAYDAFLVDLDPPPYLLIWIPVRTAPLQVQTLNHTGNSPLLLKTRFPPITLLSFPAGRSTFRCFLSPLEGAAPQTQMDLHRPPWNRLRLMSIWGT